jgi:hypothetical protein
VAGNKKDTSKNYIINRTNGLALTERSQLNGVKPKMSGRKLESCVNWQGVKTSP